MNRPASPRAPAARHTRRAIAALLLLCLTLPVGARAAAPAGRPALQTAQRGGPRGRGDGMVNLVIELAAAPSAVSFAQARARGPASAATTAAQQQLRRIDSAQRSLLPALARAGAQMLYRTQRVYNGIAVRAPASQLAALAGLPGVAAVHPLVPKQRDNSGGVPLIGAPGVWGGGAGATGAGISIGIIDTGIDYNHTNFGGSGLPADYARNDTTRLGESGLYPNARVAGGFDFVGDDYDGNNAPQPDPDPIDCAADLGGGHGSHVAGTAAGGGVKADGSAYSGPYNNSVDFTQFRIGPGAAPQASLYALRVFGCNGSTNVVDQALEWASDPNGDGDFADHLDVVNMSLGSDYGGSYDSTAVASENAVRAGVIVVASAGNSGDAYYVTGSPGSADSVISVASSVDASDVRDGVRVDAPAAIGGPQPASFSAAYDWAGAASVADDVVYPPSQRSGCAAFDAGNAALIRGKIALLDWSDNECGSVARTNNVVTAGGLGAILVDNSAIFDLGITGSALIPAVSVAKETGDLLKANLVGLRITFDGALANSIVQSSPAQVDTLSSFSSRGGQSGGGLKPDISAPGESIFSARSGSGSQGEVLSGTSMAAPHVAGAMALLRQLHLNWSVAELKALAMNTATQDLRSDLPADAQIYGPARVGAGRLSLGNAANTQVLLYNAASPNIVSLSFGAAEVVTSTTTTRQVTVYNKGASVASFDLSYTPITTVPGVSYSVSPASVRLAAGAKTGISVTMRADASKMKHSRDATVAEEQAGEARHWISEASGYLTLQAPGATSRYRATIRSFYENPPVESAIRAGAVFTYTGATNILAYQIRFSSPITLTAAHIHRGAAGANGEVAYTLTGTGSFSMISGSIMISAADAAQLRSGGLYVNFDTAANPTGELRGQIVAAEPALRLPIYAAPRPAAAMGAAVSSLLLSSPTAGSASLAVGLAGSGVNTGASSPPDERSLVSAFELQERSPQIAGAGSALSRVDLQYIGVQSDYRAIRTISGTTIAFGISSYGSWTSPNAIEFDIYIDTDADGLDDYVLYNTNTGSGAPSDVFITALCTLQPSTSCATARPLNGLSAEEHNSAPFNTNVMTLAVDAQALGLTAAQDSFRYQVLSFDPAVGQIDQSDWLSYSLSKPGLAVSGGIGPAFILSDQPGATIGVAYNRANYIANRAQGLLLLHHHNRAGSRAEVVAGPFRLIMPILLR